MEDKKFVEINDEELDQVVGGTVIIAAGTNEIAFTSRNIKYRLNGISARDARNVVLDLMDANPDMSDAEFDKLVRNTFNRNGWLA